MGQIGLQIRNQRTNNSINAMNVPRIVGLLSQSKYYTFFHYIVKSIHGRRIKNKKISYLQLENHQSVVFHLKVKLFYLGLTTNYSSPRK